MLAARVHVRRVLGGWEETDVEQQQQAQMVVGEVVAARVDLALAGPLCVFVFMWGGVSGWMDG